MAGAPRVLRRNDGLEAVSALRVGVLVAPVAVARVVVFAELIGVPELEQRIGHRPALRRQHLAAHYEARTRILLEERSALRRLRLEEWTFGLAQRAGARLSDCGAGKLCRYGQCQAGDEEAAAAVSNHFLALSSSLTDEPQRAGMRD